MTPTVAVTGAAGYLGSRLATELGDGLTAALVRSPVAYLAPDRQVTMDLLSEPAPLVKALAGVDAVIHLAGHNEVVAAEDPGRALTETQLLALNVARAASAAGARRIVYVSTVHVYGRAMTADAVLDEAVAPAPSSTYAIARLACEHIVREAAPDLEAVVFRLTNAVGAPVSAAIDRWTLVASDLCRQAAEQGELRLRTSGIQSRDFVALDDVCSILAAAADADRLPPGTYNLGSGAPLTVRGLAELVQDRFERLTGERPPLHAPPPEGSPPAPYHVAMDRLAAHGLRAATPLEAAVDELATFCLRELRT